MSKWNELFEEESKHFANSLPSLKEQSWSLPFCQYAIIMTNVALSFISTAIIEGNEESTEVDKKKFAKKLGKFKRKEIQSLLKFFLMDYIVWLSNDHKKMKHLLMKGITPEQVVETLVASLRFSKSELEIFDEVKENFETIKHSRMLLTKLGLGKQAYTEFLVDTVEEVKNEFYHMMDKRFDAMTSK